MVLQSGGQIDFWQINNEFARGYDLNSYRGTFYYTPTGYSYFPSGEIHFSDFFNSSSTSQTGGGYNGS
jgi:hypothetical protein